MVAGSSGYVDLQVNGYAGVDFNSDDLAADALHAACERLAADGNAGVLATFITDKVERMCARIARLVRLREEDETVRRLILGIHIEGPFLNENPGWIGAHPPQCVRPADVESMRRLLDAAAGLARIVTLAPERDPDMATTRFVAGQGIVVSAGHCDPSLEQLEAGIDAGLSMFTHLGNGCPQTLERHNNIIMRVLSMADSLRICFIADGVHIPYVALGSYLRLAGTENSVVVTDAIAAAGLGPGRYRFGAQEIEVDEHLTARIPGNYTHLAGSAITMPHSVSNLRDVVGLGGDEIRRLTSENPRRLLEAD